MSVPILPGRLRSSRKIAAGPHPLLVLAEAGAEGVFWVPETPSDAGEGGRIPEPPS